MEIRKYFQDGKVFRGLAVTRNELEIINKKYKCNPPILDRMIKNTDSKGYVGVVFGDVEAFIKLKETRHGCFFMDIQYVRENFKDVKTSTFTFEEAMMLAKMGFVITRSGEREVNGCLVMIDCEIKRVIDGRILDWSPTQDEIFADDWITTTIGKNACGVDDKEKAEDVEEQACDSEEVLWVIELLSINGLVK